MKRAKLRDYRLWHLQCRHDDVDGWRCTWILGKAPREYREPDSNVVRIERRPRERRARVR